MKRLRYIIACLLSVLIIYVGAGVAVMHYCCNRCESSHVESHQHVDMPCEVQHAQHATASSCGSCSVQETQPSCCTSASVKHQSVATHGEQLCHSKGCTVSIYKLELVKYSFESVITVPVINLLCQELPDLMVSIPRMEDAAHHYTDTSPPAVGSRQYLALYSTLLI